MQKKDFSKENFSTKREEREKLKKEFGEETYYRLKLWEFRRRYFPLAMERNIAKQVKLQTLQRKKLEEIRARKNKQNVK